MRIETQSSAASSTEPYPQITSTDVKLCAEAALKMELFTYPKPGLVSLVDSGSHDDMNAETFFASIDAILPFLGDMFDAGSQGASLHELKTIGLHAEAAMYQATSGVNTHKGAIFSMGLLAAASGISQSQGTVFETQRICSIITDCFSDDILNSYSPTPTSAGEQFYYQWNIGGARMEAAKGFPSVREHGLPALTHAIEAGLHLHDACLHAFYHLLAGTEDTTLLKRGGKAGMEFAQACAEIFTQSGSVFSKSWQPLALSIHAQFVERRLSAGGCADLLAATVFCYLMQEGTCPDLPC